MLEVVLFVAFLGNEWHSKLQACCDDDEFGDATDNETS